jgi:hypothetical protein
MPARMVHCWEKSHCSGERRRLIRANRYIFSKFNDGGGLEATKTFAAPLGKNHEMPLKNRPARLPA